MENLKLVSVRLIPDVLERLDKLAASHEYYTRSACINNLLNAVLTCSSPGTLWKMLSTYYPDDKGFRIKFEIDRELLEQRKHDFSDK